MKTPNEVMKEAWDALDHLGEVMATAAPPVAPDFAMRTAIAIRDGLTRHTPGSDGSCDGPCSWVIDAVMWPCADAKGYLSILGITWADRD